MKVSMRGLLVAVGLVAAIALPGAALAGHGKVGLWEITTKMDMTGMPQMTPEQLEKMRAMGIQMPMGRTFTVQHCMTPQEVAMDKPPSMGREHQCSMQNLKVTGQSFSEDMVCNTAEMQGNGHMDMNFDSAEHYSGKVSFNGMAHGQHSGMTTSFEGKWIAADCGAVKH